MAKSPIVAPVTEREIDAKTKGIFEEIKAAYGTHQVPELYRLFARFPMYLETSWKRMKTSFFTPGKLDVRTKWMIGLAISASNNNKPMIVECTAFLKKQGVSDTELAELMAVVDVTNGLSKTHKAARALLTN